MEGAADMSLTFQPIVEILAAAESIGSKSTEIRLGTNWMREFREWAAKSTYLSTRTSPGAGEHNEYSGIPVAEVANDNRPSYPNEQGNDVILG
jgi:hypothetical protein